MLDLFEGYIVIYEVTRVAGGCERSFETKFGICQSIEEVYKLQKAVVNADPRLFVFNEGFWIYRCEGLDQEDVEQRSALHLGEVKYDAT